MFVNPSPHGLLVWMDVVCEVSLFLTLKGAAQAGSSNTADEDAALLAALHNHLCASLARSDHLLDSVAVLTLLSDSSNALWSPIVK